MKLREEQRLYKKARILAKQFKGKSGVIDIEFGLKKKKEELRDELALRLIVKEKKSKNKLKKSEIFPEKVGGFTTDVLEHRITEKQVRQENPRSIISPLIGGIQIQSSLYGNNRNYWGTMGCFYRIKNHILGFTNYHVLYGSTPVSIVKDNYIGSLTISQNLNKTNNRIGKATNLFSQRLDYATFVVMKNIDQRQSINQIRGQLSSYKYPQIGMSLIKSGARTGITYGIIDGRSCIDCSELSIHIDSRYPNGIGKISDKGDSGSVWLLNINTDSPKPIALHYGGGETQQWAKAKTFASIFASIRNKLNNQNQIL